MAAGTATHRRWLLGFDARPDQLALKGFCLMKSFPLRWAASACLLLPSITRLAVLVVVLVFVLIMAAHGYNVPATLGVLGTVVAVTVQISQQVLNPLSAPPAPRP